MTCIGSTCALDSTSHHTSQERIGGEFFIGFAVLVLQDLFEMLLPVEQHQVARNQEKQEGSEHRLPAAAAGRRYAGGKGGRRRSDFLRQPSGRARDKAPLQFRLCPATPGVVCRSAKRTRGRYLGEAIHR